MKTKFATPGQRQMWIDAIMNIQTLPLPAEYDSESWDEVPAEDDQDAEISADELQDILDDEGLAEENLNEAQGDELAKGQVKIESDLIIAKNQYGKTKTWMWDTKKDTPRFKGKQDLWVKETTREAKKWAKGLNEEDITEARYNFDPTLKSIQFSANGYEVHGLYNTEYEDLFYKIWITNGADTVYMNDYGNENLEADKISDDLVDQFLDDLITYAMEADPNLQESFEFVEEDVLEEGVAETIMSQLGGSKFTAMTGAKALTHGKDNVHITIPKNKSPANRLKITLNSKDLYNLDFAKQKGLDYDVVKSFKDIDAENLRKVFTDYTGMKTSLNEETLEEDINNITMLQNFKGNKATLKFKNGDSIDIASDEAKIIAKRYSELKGDLQKKFADMLNKNSTTFLLAYKDAYKD